MAAKNRIDERQRRWTLLAAALMLNSLVAAASTTDPNHEHPVLQKPSLSIVPRPAPSLPEAPEGAIGPYSLRLDDKTQLQFLAIGYHRAEDRKWWRPDGSPLESAPYDFTAERVKGRMTRELVFRLVSEEPNAHLHCELFPSPELLETAEPVSDEPIASGMRAFIATLRDERETVIVQAGVATGAWELVSEHGPRGGKHGPHTWVVRQNEDTLTATVTGDLEERQRRIVAVLQDGSTRPIEGTSEPVGRMVRFTATVRGLKRADVKSLRFEARSYKWCEFEPVATMPGAEADTKVYAGRRDRVPASTGIPKPDSLLGLLRQGTPNEPSDNEPVPDLDILP